LHDKPEGSVYIWMIYMDTMYVIQGMKRPCVPVNGVPEMRCKKMVQETLNKCQTRVTSIIVRKRCSLTIYTISHLT